MVNNSPYFSIIIPTYNRSTLLKTAIESVLNQTFSDFELIIVDDNSLDNTLEIINSFNDSRIFYFENTQKKGGAGARNTGILKARGQWIAFLDDDDYWHPNKLDMQHKKIKSSNNNVAIIYSGYSAYDFDNNIEIRKYIPRYKGYLYYELLYRNIIGTFSTVVIKKSILLEVDGLNENLQSRQDIDLYVRIAEKYYIDYVEDILVKYRIDNSDRISKNYKKRLQGNIDFHNKYIRNNKKASLKIKCCSTARILTYAIAEKKWSLAIKNLFPSILLLFLDFRYFLTIFNQIFKIFLGK